MPEVSLARYAGIKKPSKWEGQNVPVYIPLDSGIQSNLHLHSGSSPSFGICTTSNAGNPTVAKVAGMKNESK
jgi:hypothetical protein